jgi:hypothetical protein
VLLEPVGVAREAQQVKQHEHDRRLRRRLGHVLPLRRLRGRRRRQCLSMLCRAQRYPCLRPYIVERIANSPGL